MRARGLFPVVHGPTVGEPVEEGVERIVRYYRHRRAHERDAARLAQHGWEMVRLDTAPPTGWRRWLAIGVLPAPGRPEPELLVVYGRALAASDEDGGRLPAHSFPRQLGTVDSERGGAGGRARTSGRRPQARLHRSGLT